MSNVKLVHSTGNGTSIAAPAANPSSNITLKVPSTTGTAGQAIKVASANHSATNAELEWGVSGITEADQWRLTSDFSGGAYITTNLERNDTAGFGQLGTGVSQASGVFSFPDEGIWLVEMCTEHKIASADNRGFRPTIYVTTNNGGAWTLHDQRGGSAYNSSNTTYSSATSSTIVDVTDKTQVKVKFYAGSINASGVTRGSSTENSTSFTFIRLGDT